MVGMLKAYPVVGKQKAVEICNAFIAGAPKSAEGSVFYGVNDSNIYHWCRESAAGRAWYLDNSWFDVTRGTHYRVSKNAPQIDGTGTSDGKRFAAMGLEIKPWRRDGKHIVVCLQSDGFTRVVGGIERWALHAHTTLGRVSTRELRVREWSADKPTIAQSLVDDLQGAWALATHSSAAAITALLEGVPIVSQAGATRIMGRDLEDVEQPIYPADRERFFGVLADNQWSIAEMRAGMAWRMLNR